LTALGNYSTPEFTPVNVIHETETKINRGPNINVNFLINTMKKRYKPY